MKYYKLFFVVLVLFQETTRAQTVFAPDGAVWHYNAFSQLASGGHCRFDVMGDTLIEGHECKKINQLTTYYYPTYDLFVTQSGPEFFTFTDEDRVYFYLDNQLDTLFDFSLEPGDTYKITFGDYCDTAIVQVTDTGIMTINDMQLRYYNVETISDFIMSTWAVSGTVVERIGNFDYLIGNPNCLVDYDMVEGLRCYSDPEFGWYGTVEEDMCDFIIGVDEMNILHQQMLVFPNPLHGMLNITLGTKILDHESANIEIANMQGQLVSRFELKHYDTTYNFDLSELAPGTYLLALRMSGVLWCTETIVVE